MWKDNYTFRRQEEIVGSSPYLRPRKSRATIFSHFAFLSLYIMPSRFWLGYVHFLLINIWLIFTWNQGDKTKIWVTHLPPNGIQVMEECNASGFHLNRRKDFEWETFFLNPGIWFIVFLVLLSLLVCNNLWFLLF